MAQGGSSLTPRREKDFRVIWKNVPGGSARPEYTPLKEVSGARRNMKATGRNRSARRGEENQDEEQHQERNDENEEK
eukprot:9216100-Pyramimonas_sp.AAC.1